MIDLNKADEFLGEMDPHCDTYTETLWKIAKGLLIETKASRALREGLEWAHHGKPEDCEVCAVIKKYDRGVGNACAKGRMHDVWT